VLGLLPAEIFAVSSELRREMIREGFPARRVRVLHNGIDPGTAPTPFSRARARRALGVPDDVLLIGTAGRLDPVKDFSTLITAVAEHRLHHAATRLVIIGDGPERAALERLAATAPGTVVFTGYRSDVRDLLPALEIFVNSSTHEGVSLTILEAMAAALPVIATRVGGTPEVVLDNETGLLVPPQNPMSLAAAVNALAQSPDRRQRMGEAARLRMKSHFSLETMTRAYLTAYLGEDA
jgi:glycosyltransferase involved in cell wall biosynthesis